MANKKNRDCFNESVKLNSKEKEEDLCCVGERKEDNISSELSKYCNLGVNMWLTLGKDFYI